MPTIILIDLVRMKCVDFLDMSIFRQLLKYCQFEKFKKIKKNKHLISQSYTGHMTKGLHFVGGIETTTTTPQTTTTEGGEGGGTGPTTTTAMGTTTVENSTCVGDGCGGKGFFSSEHSSKFYAKSENIKYFQTVMIFCRHNEYSLYPDKLMYGN